METIAWAAGLFEGEGSITKRHGKAVLQMKMCDRESVARFAQAVDTPGRVLGPYENKSTDGYPRSAYYVWTVNPSESKRVFDLLAPWLGSIRLARARAVGLLE